jgi:hypothetical protein
MPDSYISAVRKQPSISTAPFSYQDLSFISHLLFFPSLSNHWLFLLPEKNIHRCQRGTLNSDRDTGKTVWDGAHAYP